MAPTPVIFPPEVYPIPGATLFALSTVPPGLDVTNAAPVVLVTIPIPAQSVGVINGIEYGANALTMASLLTFVVRFNQGPVLVRAAGLHRLGECQLLEGSAQSADPDTARDDGRGLARDGGGGGRGAA